MNPLLIISPHLDDAVLSCGARIAEETQSGRTVIVATCFTSPGEDAAEHWQQLYHQRRLDDVLALQSLGAELRHLEFTDAPFRSPQYHNFNTILFHHHTPEEEPPHRNIQGLIRQLTTALVYLIEEINPSELLFPLGVGGHIDHHIAWECSKAFWDKSGSLSFYEDLPYALLPWWSDVRRQQLQHPAPSIVNPSQALSSQNCPSQAGPSEIPGSEVSSSISPSQTSPLQVIPSQSISPQVASPQPRSSLTIPDLAQVSLPWVRNYITTPDDLRISQDKLDKEYARLNPDVHNASTWVLGNNIFIRSLHRAFMDDFDKKCQAIRHYTTEWPILFGPDENNIGVLLASPVEEVVWTLKRSV